ncbi:MAG: alpha/beta hydrolase, partial [Xanthomonadales bacterium]|nr:alpha/beta hydrolase [Xanthomonadales bacterium]
MAAVLAGSLAGCSGLQVLNALTPDQGSDRIDGIPYGEHPRQRLDIYLTRTRPAKGTLVFFYGGGWEDGSRGDYRFVANAFVRDGYDVVIPDYRIYPEVRFPVFVEDAAKALGWIHREGADAGLQDGPIWLAGHSAGAHIAAMLHFDERYLRRENFPASRLVGFMGLSGAYDFLPLSSERLKAIFSPPEVRPASQPVNFVDGSEPPTLLIHGTDDDVAWPRNTRRLAARI